MASPITIILHTAKGGVLLGCAIAVAIGGEHRAAQVIAVKVDELSVLSHHDALAA